MKHIVFVLGSYYPYYSAVGKCLGNIANELEKHHKVTVICEKNVLGQADSDTLHTQTLLRVTTRMHSTRMKIDEKCKHARGLQRRYWQARLLLAKLHRFCRIALSPSALDSQVVRAYRQGLERVTEPVDVIIPTCNQFETVVAAMAYQAKHPHVQIIPYLFDLFAGSVNINRGKLLKKLHWRANIAHETRMFQAASAVFHVHNWTAHIRQHFPQYAHKAVEVEHPLLLPRQGDESVFHDDNIHLVYTGVVDTAVRNPQSTLALLSTLQCDGLCVDFYSFGSAQNMVDHYAAQCPAILAHGQVSSAQAEQARSSANLLLSIGNGGNAPQMPSKLIEYIASGKPILHFAQHAHDPALALLRDYPLAKTVVLSEPVDTAALQQFIVDHAHTTLPFEKIKLLFQSADPAYIAAQIAQNFGGGV